MKQIKIWSVLFVSILIVSTLNAESKRYEIESGIIEYVMHGGGNIMGIQTKIEGKNKAIFKEWGNVELHEESSKSVIMGRVDHTRQTIKIDSGKVFVVDYGQKAIIEYDASMLMKSAYKDLAKSTKEMILSLGGKKIGEDNILGYFCEVWKTQQMKFWVHKGLILKSKISIMGMTHTIAATNIQLNVAILDKNLNLPDFPVKPMEDYMQQDNSNTPSNLPTPEQIRQMQDMMKNFTQR